jgi:uncharacterized protein (TIGR02246 family)
MTASLEELARSYTQAWCSGDPARVARHYAPDGSLTINGGEPAEGRAAVTEAARSFMTAFPDMQVLMDDLAVRDDGGAVYRWTLVGTTPARAARATASASAASRNGRSEPTA